MQQLAYLRTGLETSTACLTWSPEEEAMSSHQQTGFSEDATTTLLLPDRTQCLAVSFKSGGG